ncbi:hypothetical protein Q1695_005784 [Nippostrongylus brasiliensis]|nr:hypothetical protein Q1695_005784 [Nippostrongylus brasiliensis]
MLIRAVEDLAESNEVNDRRRLARSSSRKQQITIRHRSAVTFLAKNPQVLCVGENKGGCDCGPSPDNVHCPVCEVCPYSWTCTCIDNRAGISCKHRHVIALRDARALVVTEDTSREIFSPSLPPTIVEDSVAPAQQRLESRKAKRSDAEMAMAVVQANMNALVEEDTDEADEKLQAIVDLLREASEIQSSACSGNPPMVPRPEMKRPGRKPKLTSVKLYTRAELRRQKETQQRDEGPNELLTFFVDVRCIHLASLFDVNVIQT